MSIKISRISYRAFTPTVEPLGAAFAYSSLGDFAAIGWTEDYDGPIDLSAFLSEYYSPDHFLSNVIPYKSRYNQDCLFLYVDYSIFSMSMMDIWLITISGEVVKRVLRLENPDRASEFQEFLLSWYEDSDGSIRYFDMKTGGDGYRHVITRDLHQNETDDIFTFADLPAVYQTGGKILHIGVNSNATRMFFFAFKSGQVTKLFSANMSTGVLTDLDLPTSPAPNMYGNVQWSPNNVDIVYDYTNASAQPYSIRKVNSITGSKSTIYEDVNERNLFPFYSSSGDYVAFTRKTSGSSDYHVAFIAADGSGSLTQLSSVTVGNSGSFLEWNSDDTKILFTLWPLGAGAKVWEIGGSVVDVENDAYVGMVTWLS